MYHLGKTGRSGFREATEDGGRGRVRFVAADTQPCGQLSGQLDA